MIVAVSRDLFLDFSPAAVYRNSLKVFLKLVSLFRNPAFAASNEI